MEKFYKTNDRVKTMWSEKNSDHIFFTSDTHFGHANIIKFCNRPFADVDEMNEKMIENWNELVKPDDTVFHLGDFAWGGTGFWSSVLDRLNGHKILILGNHDMKNLKRTVADKYFDAVLYQAAIRIGERKIYMNHFPFLTYDGCFRNYEDRVYQLFGHVHSRPAGYTGEDEERLKYLLPTQYDVGVDNNGFCPISWASIEAKLKYKTTNE